VAEEKAAAVADKTGSSTPIKNLGWIVTFAGIGINLALGILYSWSVISGGFPDTWSKFDKSLPYSIACLVFCIVMVPAGRMQDKIGPRITAAIGGVSVGAGMILAGSMNSLAGYIIGFGVLCGAGFGFGYASATPPAVKWFPKAKVGLIAGLVVSGFGLASVYAAPLTQYLMDTNGIESTFRTLGIAFLIVVVGLAMFLQPPPKGYVPPGEVASAATGKKEDFTPGEMLRTWQFYPIWFMYACGAGAGLMIISMCKSIVKGGSDITSTQAAYAVAILAVGNGGGRIIAGILSDKLGRTLTMFGFFVLQAIVLITLALASPGGVLTTFVALCIIAFMVGANYGANLSLFPSITKDFYGLKNFGMNYGLVFTAWGVGGFVLSQVAGYVKDSTGTYTFAYITSAVVLVIAAAMTFIVKAPHHIEEVQAA
jgi:OFA family oxalate/formate antiporter-like MFS transporter